MTYNYNFADLNIRLIADNEIPQNGYAPVFKADFAEPDITLHLKKGEVPQDVVPVFHTGTVGVAENGGAVIHDLGTKMNANEELFLRYLHTRGA